MPKMRLFDPDSGPAKDSSPISVADVVRLYLTHELPPKERKCDDRRHVLELFSAEFGEKPVSESKPFELRAWIVSRVQWRSDWTRRRVAGTIRACFNWATRLQFIPSNPFAGVIFPHGERGTALEPHEFQAMLKASTPIFRRFLIALRYSGARPGELASAEWCHLDMARSCIILEKHKTYNVKRKSRRIILHPIVVKLIDWLKRHRPNPRYIFVNSKGWGWTAQAISWRIQQIRDAANVRPEVTLYCCRHSFITEAVMSGVDIATVAELAGHSRISTTQHYFHVAGRLDHLQAAVQQVFRKH